MSDETPQESQTVYVDNPSERIAGMLLGAFAEDIAQRVIDAIGSAGGAAQTPSPSATPGVEVKDLAFMRSQRDAGRVVLGRLQLPNGHGMVVYQLTPTGFTLKLDEGHGPFPIYQG